MNSQRQITLPLSKAVEIAYRSIRLRLSRSLLVTSGIVLAIAFLMSILTSEAMTTGMREWANHNEPEAHATAQVSAQQKLLTLMKSNGVPITPDEVRDDRIQKRWLVGLALLVAFVGILNAMLMSVTERFREIGTMKCLGALDSFIIKLFLIESMFQGVTGSAVGVFVGVVLAIASAAMTYGHAAFLTLPAGAIFLDAVLCIVIGIGLTVAGAVYPSWQAARMQPIEAMRIET